MGWALAVALLHPTAEATYSIVASDASSGQCGVAVQTDNLAVGASVPSAAAGVGAIASQFETNPRHGPRGLALLAEGKSPAEALQVLLREDGNFEGRGIEARQIAIVSADGRTAVHTGTDANQSDWAGARSGPGYSVQGNGLAGPQVLAAMEQAYLATPGPLAERLLAALGAGEQAGGQRTGRESAALLVRTREGFPQDIDLRVDHSDDPIGQLRLIYGLQAGRQQIIEARLAGRRGQLGEARKLLSAAGSRVTTWPRGCVLAAEVAVEIEQPALALQFLAQAFEKNPARIPRVLGEGGFARLGADPQFHRWVSADLEQQALAARRQVVATPGVAREDRVAAAQLLLEIGHAPEGLALLNPAVFRASSSDDFLLLATAHQATGDLPAARADCWAGLQHHPDDPRLAARLAQLPAP